MNNPVSFLRPQLDLRFASFAGWQVDVTANQFTRGATELRVTPKAMAVLRELMARQGAVVKRDDLLGIVWRDGFPTDDVLTHAITELRRAIEDDPKNPQLIETVPRVGYRLRVPVEVHAELPLRQSLSEANAIDRNGADSARPTNSMPNATQTPWPMWAGVALLLGLVLGVPLWLKLTHRNQSDPRSTAAAQAIVDVAELVRPITSDVGFETFPSLSPDGSQIAYATRVGDDPATRIVVRSANSSSTLQLTRGQSNEDMFPVWSPDGAHIAFIRSRAPDQCRIMMVPALGGFEREIGSCMAGTLQYFHWTPDGKRIVTAERPAARADGSRPPTALVTVDLATGTMEPIVYEASPLEHDVQPQYSPDGRWLAFRRGASPYSDLYLMPGNGGEPRALTRVRSRIRGYAWLPDSKHLIFSSDHQGRLTLYLLAIETGAMRSLRLYNAEFPSVARNKNVAVYQVESGAQRMIEYDLQQNPPAGAPLVPSNRSDYSPAFAPDGQRMAFVSDRGGDKQIWLRDPQQIGAIPLTDHRGAELSELQWSADGNRVLYILRNELGSAAFSVSVLNGQTRREVPEGENVRSAAFARDGERIVYVSDRDGDWQLWQRGLNDESRVLLASEGVRNVQIPLDDGFVYFTRLADPGLWRVPLAGNATPERISPNLYFWNGDSWALHDKQLYYLFERGEGRRLSLVRETLGASKTETTIDELLALGDGGTNSFTLSPDAKRVVLIESWQPGTDVLRLDLEPLAPKP